MPHRLHEIAVGGRTFRWRETDPAPESAAAVPLVLLHAFPLSAAMWAPQFDAFPRRRIIAPDTRGFRGPDGPAAEEPGDPTMDQLATDVEHLLDALEVPQAAIGGLSMGGYIALALFRRAPARFRALMLADSRATADSEQAKAGRRKMQALADAGGVAAIADDMLPKLLGETTQRERPEVGRHVRALIEANTPAGVKSALGAMMTRQDSRRILGAIACPTLILVGDEDALTPPSDSEALHAAVDGSELVTIPRAGHLSNLEQPDAFNAALGRFLKDLS